MRGGAVFSDCYFRLGSAGQVIVPDDVVSGAIELHDSLGETLAPNHGTDLRGELEE
jgi:hypothetical protein